MGHRLSASKAVEGIELRLDYWVSSTDSGDKRTLKERLIIRHAIYSYVRMIQPL